MYIWLPLKEMGTVTRVQILDEAVNISLSVNTLGKDITPTVFHLANWVWYENQCRRGKTLNSNVKL